MAHNKPAEAPGCCTAEGSPSECAWPTGPQVVCACVCSFFRPWTLQSDFQAQVLYNAIYDFFFQKKFSKLPSSYTMCLWERNPRDASQRWSSYLEERLRVKESSFKIVQWLSCVQQQSCIQALTPLHPLPSGSKKCVIVFIEMIKP